jgi:hypothetical protein
MFFFSLGGDFASGPPPAADPVAPANILTTDAFAVLAPWGNRVLFQLGQYDAPFTLENRTSDKYLDFIERSVAVRGFGIPATKEQGLMVHGLLPSDIAYYSVGVFNGDGQNFRNVDGKFDVIGRGWIAPLTLLGPNMFDAVELGGSFWVGKRENGLALAGQGTQAGFTFLKPSWSAANPAGGSTPWELHQNGDLKAWALEVDAPVMHRFGARWEFVHKDQDLSANNVTKADSPVVGGPVKLKGYSTYGEIWGWVLGDDKIIGAPGLQLPSRMKKFTSSAPRSGLMLAARLEFLHERLTEAPETAALNLGNKVRDLTEVTSFELGVNYWYSKRYRATFNYVFNKFSGDAPSIVGLAADKEHEFLFRLAIAL